MPSQGSGTRPGGSGVGDDVVNQVGKRAGNASFRRTIISLKRKSKEVCTVASASDSTLLPKKLRADYGSLNRSTASGKSKTVIQTMLTTNIQGFHHTLEPSSHMPSLPFVSEQGVGFQFDTSAEPFLHVVHPTKRFIVSSESSSFSSAHDVEVSSFLGHLFP